MDQEMVFELASFQIQLKQDNDRKVLRTARDNHVVARFENTHVQILNFTF